METSAGPRLLDHIRDKIGLKHCSIRTKQTQFDWIRRFIWFHDKHRPSKLGATFRLRVRMSAIERRSLRPFLAKSGRRMLAQGSGGKIVNVASLLSFQGGIRVPSYTASKSSLAVLTR